MMLNGEEPRAAPADEIVPRLAHAAAACTGVAVRRGNQRQRPAFRIPPMEVRVEVDLGHGGPVWRRSAITPRVPLHVRHLHRAHGQRRLLRANVQGGVVVGAVMLRCLLPNFDWAIAGLEAPSVNTAQGATLVGTLRECILLFPMPLDSKGEILYAASTCYRRMWRTFFYMLFFAAGSVWRRRPEESQGPKDPGDGRRVGARCWR